MSTTTDDSTLAEAQRLYGVERVRPPRPAVSLPGSRRAPAGSPIDPAARDVTRAPRWLAPALLLVAAIVVGVAIGWLLRGDSGSSSPSASRPAATSARAIHEPIANLAAIDGATREDNKLVAYPGQVLTAPVPAEGKVVARQWQICTKDGCTDVDGATGTTWTSPPTPKAKPVRVVVTTMVEHTKVPLASGAVEARPWPADKPKRPKTK